MTYHLPRVVHWAQSHSVAHYATNIIRQAASPFFHEYICLDIYILSRNRDVLFNVVQCSAFLTNAWLLYEISCKLGVTKKFSIIGTLLFLSMPIAFGEALTTQNDNLAGLFLFVYVYNILDLLDLKRKIEVNRVTCRRVFILSACIGLGYLTKPSVSIGMAFFAVLLLVCCIIRKDLWTGLIKLLTLSCIIIGLIIFPQIARNIRTFNAALPSITGPRQLVGTLEPRYLLVNMLKNLLFNFPIIYISKSNEIYASAVYTISGFMGVNINDPSIAEDGKTFYLWSAGNMGHDTAVNAAVVYIFVGCLIWCIYRRKHVEKSKTLYTYMVAMLFILICAFTRWEPFVSRYMLPYLALLCPAISIWLEDMAENSVNILLKNCCVPIICWIGVTGLLQLFSFHVAIATEQNVSRPDGYFQSRSDITEEYKQACEYAKSVNAESIGLYLGEDSYEYPIWYELKYSAKRIEHVMVCNDTKKYEDETFIPECILSSDDFGAFLEYHGAQYDKWMEGSLNAYMKHQ